MVLGVEDVTKMVLNRLVRNICNRTSFGRTKEIKWDYLSWELDQVLCELGDDTNGVATMANTLVKRSINICEPTECGSRIQRRKELTERTTEVAGYSDTRIFHGSRRSVNY